MADAGWRNQLIRSCWSCAFSRIDTLCYRRAKTGECQQGSEKMNMTENQDNGNNDECYAKGGE
jgi:hypothetical protein